MGSVLWLPVMFAVSSLYLYYVSSQLPPLPATGLAINSTALKFPSTLEELQSLAVLLKHYRTNHICYIILLYSSAYLFKQTFAIPGSVFMNLLGGALFGQWVGFLLTCLLSASGATACFLLAKVCGRSYIQKYFPSQLKKVQDKIKENSDSLFFFLMFLRLFPMTPNWFLNISSPICGVPIHLFFLSVFFGLMPYNFICVQTGCLLSTLTSLDDIFSAWTMFKLFSMATAALVPGLLIKKYQEHRSNQKHAKEYEQKVARLKAEIEQLEALERKVAEVELKAKEKGGKEDMAGKNDGFTGEPVIDDSEGGSDQMGEGKKEDDVKVEELKKEEEKGIEGEGKVEEEEKKEDQGKEERSEVMEEGQKEEEEGQEEKERVEEMLMQNEGKVEGEEVEAEAKDDEESKKIDGNEEKEKTEGMERQDGGKEEEEEEGRMVGDRQKFMEKEQGDDGNEVREMEKEEEEKEGAVVPKGVEEVQTVPEKGEDLKAKVLDNETENVTINSESSSLEEIMEGSNTDFTGGTLEKEKEKKENSQLGQENDFLNVIATGSKDATSMKTIGKEEEEEIVKSSVEVPKLMNLEQPLIIEGHAETQGVPDVDPHLDSLPITAEATHPQTLTPPGEITDNYTSSDQDGNHTPMKQELLDVTDGQKSSPSMPEVSPAIAESVADDITKTVQNLPEQTEGGEGKEVCETEPTQLKYARMEDFGEEEEVDICGEFHESDGGSVVPDGDVSDGEEEKRRLLEDYVKDLIQNVLKAALERVKVQLESNKGIDQSQIRVEDFEKAQVGNSKDVVQEGMVNEDDLEENSNSDLGNDGQINGSLGSENMVKQIKLIRE